jgi:hypothetical protein
MRHEPQFQAVACYSYTKAVGIACQIPSPIVYAVGSAHLKTLQTTGVDKCRLFKRISVWGITPEAGKQQMKQETQNGCKHLMRASR